MKAARKLNASEVQYRLEDDQIELSNVWVLLKTKELYLPVVSGYLLYQSIPVLRLAHRSCSGPVFFPAACSPECEKPTGCL